ncbi:hypothetical protein ABZX85_06305 [Streptomyces sp. NPDC004539]|uniref:hypothetical protein n=1 Tax=Streptomyces sp. NPDC004539 TaxID=3154280 RepID=UPI0033B46491
MGAWADDEHVTPAALLGPHQDRCRRVGHLREDVPRGTAGDPVLNLTGDGRRGVVAPEDVAEAAVFLLADHLTNHTYTLTGPQALSIPDQAAVLATLLDHPVPTRDLTPAESRTHLLSRGWDPPWCKASSKAPPTSATAATPSSPATSPACWAARRGRTGSGRGIIWGRSGGPE